MFLSPYYRAVVVVEMGSGQMVGQRSPNDRLDLAEKKLENETASSIQSS